MRLIDADALKIDYGFTWDDITPTHDEMYALIDRQPTIPQDTDYISRQVAIDAIAETVVRGESLGYGLARDIVYDLPSVQPKRKTGNWTRISMDKYTRHAQAWYRCSECQGEFIGKWNYCPNCGSYNGGKGDNQDG